MPSAARCRRTRTTAAPGACRRTFVKASTATLYAVVSASRDNSRTAAGSASSTPPSNRSTNSGSSEVPGTEADRAPAASRSACTVRSIEASAPSPAASIRSSARTACSGSLSATNLAAWACTTMALTSCATKSCRSRASSSCWSRRPSRTAWRIRLACRRRYPPAARAPSAGTAQNAAAPQASSHDAVPHISGTGHTATAVTPSEAATDPERTGDQRATRASSGSSRPTQISNHAGGAPRNTARRPAPPARASNGAYAARRLTVMTRPYERTPNTGHLPIGRAAPTSWDPPVC